MQFWIDFFPIVLFFIVFKIAGIYPATAVAILASIVQVIYYRVTRGKFEMMSLISLGTIVIFGGATLLIHDERFIKWKVTALYGLLGIILGATQWSQKPLLKRLMGEKIELPDPLWRKLNLSWSLFFLMIAVLNLYVADHFDTATWVNFKLFGVLGLTVVFALIQAFFLIKHMKEK